MLNNVCYVQTFGTVIEYRLFDILQFTQYNHHQLIHFKAIIDKNKINFVDFTLFKGEQFTRINVINSKANSKPNDTHELIFHKASFHPKHIFSGGFKSQLARIHRICSSKAVLNKTCFNNIKLGTSKYAYINPVPEHVS